jgi:ABC-type oligopeptide transport system substrate-binding subunit
VREVSDDTNLENYMRMQKKINSSLSVRILLALGLVFLLVGSGCFEGERGELYYGRVVVPHGQEFRWSNGSLPRVFDPALAAAPPDTDAVRALFDGLTDYDPRSLVPVSAIATRWESSPDGRTWKFFLRQDIRWSNGDSLTAKDFVRSWQRTLRLGDRAPHARLLANIKGAQNAVALVADPSEQINVNPNVTLNNEIVEKDIEKPTPTPSQEPAAFGAQAIDDDVLLVHLQRPDKNFPALVAHPVFRPVHELSTESQMDKFEKDPTAAIDKKDSDSRSARKTACCLNARKTIGVSKRSL